MKKYTRQRIILDLINNSEVETQEELADLLEEKGINITQATISRDIKELRLIKVLTGKGKYKYASMETKQEGITDRLVVIFKTAVLNVTKLDNLIIIKTIPGAAQVCATVLENFKVSGIEGIIAGDDTIFVAVRKEETENIHEAINSILK